MGKASRWFRSVLGLKKSDQSSPTRPKEKRRWSFVKSYRDNNKDNHHSRDASSSSFINAVPLNDENNHRSVDDYDDDEDKNPSHRAIAVAAATAAVAEAAVAAAHAAAEVVRLTSSGGNGGSSSSAAYVSGSLGLREDFAALKIQAAFRGYLARRALKALKALVRLQALVRGHIQRKRRLQQMQAVLLAQARARVGRIHASESSQSSGGKSSHSHYYHHHYPGPATPEKIEHGIRTKSGKYEPSSLLKRSGSRSNDNKAHSSLRKSETRSVELSWDQQQGPWTTPKTTMEDERNSDKILEIDNGGGGRHHFGHKRRNMFHSANLGLFSDQYSHSFTTSKDTAPSPSSEEVQSMYPVDFSHELDQEVYCTAENSPQLFSATSGGKRSPFTPARSDGSRSFLSAFSDHPNYMSYTESARAKARSLSAPKQRPAHYERSISAKRFEARSSSAQRASAVRASFSSKAYPGSGRLDSLGLPMWQKC